MPKGSIVTGIDVGTHTMKVLVAQKIGRDWEVRSSLEAPSFGLQKGVVRSIDLIEKVSQGVESVISQAEKESNQKINSVFVNISGSHLYTVISDGIISVSRADQRISQEDVERVLQATKAIHMPNNEEVLDVFPREYIVDDHKGIKNAEGLEGVRLEAKALLLRYFMPYFTNLTQAVLNTKRQINDVIPSALAASKAVLTPEQKDSGVALIDIGAGTTSLAVFEEGELLHLVVFPVGSANITSDIAIGFKTEISIAESIKKQYGTCMYPKSEKERKDFANKKIEIQDSSYPFSFTKKQLIDIVKPRISEILDLAQKELRKIGKQGMLPSGIIITGGGARMPKIKELARETFQLNCQIGQPKGLLGLESDPSLATVVGLVLGGIDFGDDPRPGVGDLLSKIKRFFRNFLP